MNESVPCTGQVVGRDGRPVPHAFIVIVDGPAPVPEIALVADDDGRFSFALLPGEWTVQARGDGGAGETRVAVSPPETGFVITIP
jgi:hypothetical protein